MFFPVPHVNAKRADHTALRSLTLPRTYRLGTNAVGDVLRFGRRLQAAVSGGTSTGRILSIKAINRAGEPQGAHARLAIAVPKRLMKSAVDRNRVKRWAREAFRQHALKLQPVDLLVTLGSKVDLTVVAQREQLRYALVNTLDAVQREAERSRLPLVPSAQLAAEAGQTAGSRDH
jgi:ribonuclease P protein component